MKWNKLGLIFNSNNNTETMFSHAAVPIAENIENDIFKIYFSSRDSKNKSYVNFIVIDINKPTDVISISKNPVLTPGNLGEFDDSGSMGSWIVNHDNKKYFYYIGWNLGVTVPFRNSIGLAIADEDNNFKRIYDGPIIDRSITEPNFVASSCVIKDQGIWKMWYLSCTSWKIINKKVTHKYHIKYAESKDGINWNRDGLIAIDYEDINEYAISRPCVVRDQDIWKMWYSFRGDKYKIGYAESADGKKWNRLDHKVGISVSDSGWDSDMIEYPFVFKHKNELYMLYNGNGYGLSGFGLAILEK
jgi:predicted GH43/DUF377 family glycosyl hydrolase